MKPQERIKQLEAESAALRAEVERQQVEIEALSRVQIVLDSDGELPTNTRRERYGELRPTTGVGMDKAIGPMTPIQDVLETIQQKLEEKRNCQKS